MTSASLKTTIAHWVLNGSLLGLEPNRRKRDHAVKRVTAVIILILLQLLLVLPSLPYCNKTRPHFIKLDMLWLLHRRFCSRDRRVAFPAGDGLVTKTATLSTVL